MLFPLWGGGSKFHLLSSWDVQRGDSSSLEFSGVGEVETIFGRGEIFLDDLGYLT